MSQAKHNKHRLPQYKRQVRQVQPGIHRSLMTPAGYGRVLHPSQHSAHGISGSLSLPNVNLTLHQTCQPCPCP